MSDPEPPLTPEEIERRIVAAEQEVFALCKAVGPGGRRWRMSVPVDPTDSDIVIIDALDAARQLLASLPVGDDTPTEMFVHRGSWRHAGWCSWESAEGECSCGLDDARRTLFRLGSVGDDTPSLDAITAALHEAHCVRFPAIQPSHRPTDVAGYGLYDCQRYAAAVWQAPR